MVWDIHIFSISPSKIKLKSFNSRYLEIIVDGDKEELNGNRSNLFIIKVQFVINLGILTTFCPISLCYVNL